MPQLFNFIQSLIKFLLKLILVRFNNGFLNTILIVSLDYLLLRLQLSLQSELSLDFLKLLKLLDQVLVLGLEPVKVSLNHLFGLLFLRQVADGLRQFPFKLLKVFLSWPRLCFLDLSECFLVALDEAADLTPQVLDLLVLLLDVSLELDNLGFNFDEHLDTFISLVFKVLNLL